MDPASRIVVDFTTKDSGQPGSEDEMSVSNVRDVEPLVKDGNSSQTIRSTSPVEYGSTRDAELTSHQSDTLSNGSSRWASKQSRDAHAGSYPAGFSENGGADFALPSVLPPLQGSHANKKRRRKKRSVAPLSSNTEDEERATSNENARRSDEEAKLTQAEYLQRALDRPEYIKPIPNTLPPISAKNATFALTTAAALSPVIPEMDKTEHPVEVDGRISSWHPELGTTNDSFQNNDGAIIGKSFTKASSGNSTIFANTSDVPMEQLPKRPKATRYFRDGVRYIDYVMAYEEEEGGENNDIREVFEANLAKKGLQLEHAPKEESQDQKTCFVKIHVPWETAVTYAERMKLKMRLKEDKIREETEEEDHEFDCSCLTKGLSSCLKPFKLNDSDMLEQNDSDYYTAEFSRANMRFFDIQDKNTFFSTSERSRIAFRIMSETKYGPKATSVGITQLLSDGGYSAAFPLHEGRYTSRETKMPDNANMRRFLYKEWARWGRWYKYQPLDLIRQYLGVKIAIYFAFLESYVKSLMFASVVGVVVFAYGCLSLLFPVNPSQYLGDRVGLYFAWLGFYTEMLLYPTFVGFIIIIYSIATLWTYPPTQEVCDSTFETYSGDLVMCPVCDADCGYWNLSSSCLSAQITHVFDNEATIFFAVFMSLWATMFLEFWKRKQFRLAYDWDLVDYDEERDLIRPEFEARVRNQRLNPINGQLEPYLNAKERYSRACFSITAVFFWVLLVLAAVLAVIIYRLVIAAVFASSLNLSSLPETVSAVASPSMLTTITASVISLVVIMLLNFFYDKVAYWLTEKELPRTQTEFDDSFAFKMFCFQFVNYYSYLFYVAFFKQSFAGYPSNYTYLFGLYRWDECDAGGCMYELSIQLIIIMLGKQIWNNFIELAWPWLTNKYREYKSTQVSLEKSDNDYTRWEQDYDLNTFKQMGLLYEYLEMIIQFGFVTLFVAAFPLAPVLALLNNIIEIRLDAQKFMCQLRRPLAQKCSDIGAWFFLLDFIGTLSVVTNAFTIAVTSDAVPKMVYYYVYSEQEFGYSTLKGYTNNSLSYFNVSDFSDISLPTKNPLNVTVCRYRDYRTPPDANPPYELTTQYWHIIAGRLAFVIVMEHVVFFLKQLLDYLIPDRSRTLKQKIKREYFLVHQMLLTGNLEDSEDSKRRTPKPTTEENKFFVEREKKITPF